MTRRARSAWRWAPLLAVAGVVVTMMPGSAALAPQGLAAAVVVPAAVPLPAACKPKLPDPEKGGYTQYGFVSRVQGGTMKGDGPLRVTDIDVSVCGVVEVVNAESSSCKNDQGEGIQGKLIIPAEGVVTNGLKASLAIPGMPVIENVPAEVTAEPMSSYVECDSSKDGLKMDLVLKVNGSAGAFGLKCDVAFAGEVHGVVTGHLLTDDYQGDLEITGEVDAGRVSNHDKFCPGWLPDRVDKIAGLPAGGYQVDWPGKVSIYHPATG